MIIECRFIGTMSWRQGVEGNWNTQQTHLVAIKRFQCYWSSQKCVLSLTLFLFWFVFVIVCSLKVERQNLEKHLLDRTSSHLSLACKKLVSFRKEFDDEKAKFKKQIDDLKKDNDILIRKLSAQEKGTSKPKMETPTFVWKLSAFSEMLLQAKRGRNVKIHSTPFYTAPFGYKLKLSVKPNGDGSGKNTHLSVFVIVMKGEYDGMLLWPFNQRVSFTLIDQQESSDERENIVMHFGARTNPENFVRPVSEENPGRGFARFVSHEKLKTRQFIVEDTLFIQVDVRPL